jgi:molybdate transport system substrate-binding protein
VKTITALLAVASLTLAACGSSSSSNTSSSSSGSSNTTASSGGAYGYGGGSSSKKTTAANTSSAAGTSITVAMKDYSFGPKVISGKPGSTVHVKLVNNSANEHNFKIDGQKGADADVQPGKTGTAVVKIPTSGSLQFYCEYHKGLGMVGTVKAT